MNNLGNLKILQVIFCYEWCTQVAAHTRKVVIKPTTS